MRGDTRAVSPAVTQALTIGISTILITGLLVAGSSFIDAKQENTIRQGLQDVGSGVASDLVRLDQFITRTGAVGVSYTSSYPDRVGNEAYRIEISDSGSTDTKTIAIDSASSNLGTEIRFETSTDICSSRTATGGTIEVFYDESNACLGVRST